MNETQPANDKEIAEAMLLSLAKKTHDNTNSLQWQMDVNESVKNILMMAGGYFYDEDNKQLLKCKTSSLNATGLLRIAEIMTTYLNKDVILSNTVMNEIQSIMYDFIEKLTIELYINREEYGVSIARLPMTVGCLVDFVYLMLKRSYMDGTRVHNETVMKYVESIMSKENKRGKRNLLGGDE